MVVYLEYDTHKTPSSSVINHESSNARLSLCPKMRSAAGRRCIKVIMNGIQACGHFTQKWSPLVTIDKYEMNSSSLLSFEFVSNHPSLSLFYRIEPMVYFTWTHHRVHSLCNKSVKGFILWEQQERHHRYMKMTLSKWVKGLFFCENN